MSSKLSTSHNNIGLLPRPWDSCPCLRCQYYIFLDLSKSFEKSSDTPLPRYIHNGLSRWTVWITSANIGFPGSGIVPYFLQQLDSSTNNYLESRKITNWWFPSTNLLYPIVIKGDGNCLPHAVSTYLWGVQDLTMTLRNLIYQTLVTSGTELFRERWKREKEWHNAMIPDGGLQYDEEEWNKEWTILVDAAHPYRQDLISNLPRLPYESLEELHIFVLANVLRRPIIVLGPSEISSMADGKALEYNNMVGIYLPLLWPSKQCYKYPIVLSFLFNHLEPLLSQVAGQPNDRSWHNRNFVPLVTSSLEMLRVHFTVLEEEMKLHNLLQNYLYVEEVPFTRDRSTEPLLVARLPEPEVTITMIRSYTRRRAFTAKELQYFRIDKKLVYYNREHEENLFTNNEFCTPHATLQLVLERDLRFVRSRSTNVRERGFTKHEKLIFTLVLRMAMEPKPLYTIRTEEELSDSIEKIRSLAEQLRAGKSPSKGSSVDKALELLRKSADIDYDDDEFYDDDDRDQTYLISAGDKLLVLTAQCPKTADSSQCRSHIKAHGRECHCQCQCHHCHGHGWDVRKSLTSPKASKSLSRMLGGAGSYSQSGKNEDGPKQLSKDSLVDIDLDSSNISGVQEQKSLLEQNAERKQKILHSTSKSFNAGASAWGEEVDKTPQELNSSNWVEAGWKKSPDDSDQYYNQLDTADNENINEIRFNANSNNINNNNFTHDRLSDDISRDFNPLSENSRDALDSDITGTSTPLNPTIKSKEGYRNREVDLNCSEISDIEKSKASCIDTEAYRGNSSIYGETNKCANVACTRAPQEGSAYCKTCDFQQRTVQMTLQSDTFGATGGNSLLELFQSISAQSQDKRNWKTISGGSEKLEDSLE